MFDSQKIDSYFDNQSAYKDKRLKNAEHTFSWRRLFKLILPCLAAALFGLMMVIPNIKKSVDLSDNLTLPRKNEMEQLHIEKTEFNIVDNKNRVNKIFADNVDEAKSGSSAYKINNPQAIIPTDGGIADITAKVGYFNQNENNLRLVQNVKAIVDNDTVVTTEAAIYNFNKRKGWGKDIIRAKGKWGNMRAEAFGYDRETELLILKGEHFIKTARGILTGKKETRIYRLKNKSVTIGNATLIQNHKKLYADKIVAYFSNTSKKELLRAEAYGNVRVITPKNRIYGGEGYYDAKTGKVTMYATSKSKPKQKSFVTVKQDDNILRARKMVLNLAKSKNSEVESIVAIGDVRLISPDEIITAGEGFYAYQQGRIDLYGTAQKSPVQEDAVEIIKGEHVLHANHIVAFLDSHNKVKRADAYGDVEILTAEGAAWGDKGVYNPVENKVELFDNVRIEQNNNYILGAHAETDLQTSVSKITGDETTNGRIRGVFYKKRK